jgi:hypothetical protein
MTKPGTEESRQAKYLHRLDVESLSTYAAEVPVLIHYDPGRHAFTVTWIQDAAREAQAPDFIGRFQVVRAYLTGILHARRSGGL